ncbi:MAG: leucine dehydrogenase [Bdellovibrionales bacterium]|nr:leucine dehydrogenase [Bdellovibrionales bacterium]
MVFQHIEEYGNHEQVMFFHEPSVNLKGIIAIHNTALGPAIGGCRMWPYASEKEALIDVLRLSRGMTYKSAAAGLEQGGGKSVIICDPKHKTPELFKTFGRFIHSLNGVYITAEDVGTSVEDMQHIRATTPFVTGLSEQMGGSGDPSPFTAQSTLVGIKAAVSYKLNRESLEGLKVAVQGMGHVGGYLAEYLLKEGCQISICDIFERKAKDFQEKYPQVKVVDHQYIYDEDCDIFSPCALGSVISVETLKRLKCSIIAGAANNQLDKLEREYDLRKKNILYAPDFVINAGGVINVFVESQGSYTKEEVQKRIAKIYHVLKEIFTRSEEERKNPTDVAIEIANNRIQRKL